MPFINFYSAKPTLKLLIVFLTILASGLIVSFTGLLLGKLMFWMHLDEINNVLFNRTDLLTNWQLKYFQIVQTIGYFIVPGILLYWFFSEENNKYYVIRKKPSLLSIMLVMVMLVAAIPFLNMIIDYNRHVEIPSFMRGFETRVTQMEDQYAHLTERLLYGSNFGCLLFNILMIAVLPAIGEEMLFRGVLQRLFNEFIGNIHMAIVITAIIFSAVHGQFYSFIPRFFLGILFGYLMVWSKTIWLPAIAHFLNNCFAVVMYYMRTTKAVEFKLPDLFTGSISVVVSLTIVVGLAILLSKTERKADH